LFEAALGLRVRNATCRAVVESSAGEPTTEQTASRDLKALVVAGLLTPIGERRGRVDAATDDVRSAQAGIRRRPRRARRPLHTGIARRFQRLVL